MTHLLPQPPVWPTTQPSPAAGRRVLIAWLLIIANASFSVYRGATYRERAQNGEHNANLQLELLSRYAVGCKLLFGHSAAASPASMYSLVKQVRDTAHTPLDHLRAIPVIAELAGKDEGVREAAQFLHRSPPDDLIGDATALEKAYLGEIPSPDATERQRLLDQFGWYGQLAVSQFPPVDPSIRVTVEKAARRAIIAFYCALAVMGLLLFAGIVLGILFLVLWLAGNLRPGFLAADPAAADVLVEGFAVYLSMMTAISLVELILPRHAGLGWNALLFVPVVCAVWWVRASGISGSQLAATVGWNRGRGIAREMFAGFVGYVAGIPILGAGMILSLYLGKLTETKATHPIESLIQSGGWMRVALIFLACVFAPVAEELVFRGMLLRHLTLRLPWFLSAVIVSIIFAAIHPQGWTAIPVLAAVGLILAMIRIQRNSLVASMTAHALNNGLLMIFLISALG